MSRPKKARVFSREFKLQAVERMLAGESSRVLARALDLRRKLLYEWKDAYLCGGAAALRTRGRPCKDQLPGLLPAAETVRAELLQARQRIAELERKVGKQQLEIDFFAEALRRVEAVRAEQTGRSAQRSTRSWESKPRKAN